MHTQEEAAEILEPFIDPLAELWPAAWGRWTRLGEDYPEAHVHLSARARASLLYDWAAARARTLFSGQEPSVRFEEAYGFLLICIEDHLYLRLKKFRNGTLTSCGIPTRQNRLFAAQEPLPGMPKATNLVLGYQLDPFQTGIERVAVSCSLFNRVMWSLDLPAPGGAVVIKHPAAPQGPLPPSIRSKRGQEEQRNEGS